MTLIKNKLRKINAKLNPARIVFSPEWLVLGVNNFCNLHCKMCDVGTKSETVFADNLVGTRPLNMPPDLFKKIVDQSVKFYPRVKLGYAFTEPLVYKHLEETLAYAQKNRIHTAITTNALNLKQKAKQICETGCKQIFISLDGPEEIHNFIRGNNSSFQRAIEGIEELLKNKNAPRISVFCVITEWNIGYLNRFVTFFKKYPIAQLGFMHNIFTNPETATRHNAMFGEFYRATVSNTDESDVAKMNLEMLWHEINQIKKLSVPFKISFSPELSDYKRLKIFYEQPEFFIGKACNDVFRNMMIKSDGTVIPAHGRCYNLTVGNLYQQTLPEIWNSSVFSRFRVDLKKAGGMFPACSRCCSAY